MQIDISLPADFSYPETLAAHGWRRLLPFVSEDSTQTLERVEQLSDGTVVLLTLQEQHGRLAVATKGEWEEQDIVRRVRRMLQLNLPVSEFHGFCAEHPKLCAIPEKRQGRMLVSPTVWEDVVKVIATTNTTWSQTIGMVQRIVDAFGSPLPSDPTRHAFPSPVQIAAVPFDEFAAKARMGYRNSAVHSLALEIAEGKTDIESLANAEVSTGDLWKRLLALRGVGPYAASCLMIYLGHYGRVNVDSWARMMVSQELGHPVSDKDVHAFFQDYGKWQGIVYQFYPWRELETA